MPKPLTDEGYRKLYEAAKKTYRSLYRTDKNKQVYYRPFQTAKEEARIDFGAVLLKNRPRGEHARDYENLLKKLARMPHARAAKVKVIKAMESFYTQIGIKPEDRRYDYEMQKALSDLLASDEFKRYKDVSSHSAFDRLRAETAEHGKVEEWDFAALREEFDRLAASLKR